MDRYNQHQIFAYLARRTDRDIFSIRTPFEKVNILSESGKWDGRNGTVFVAFQALWKLSKIWSPDPDFDHTFPLKCFWTHKSLWSSICFQVISKSFQQSPEYSDMLCTATGYAPQPLLSGYCWPTTFSVPGRLPTFPLRIKSLYRTLRCQQNQLSNGYKKTSRDILSQAKKTINLENKLYKIENDANKIFCSSNKLSHLVLHQSTWCFLASRCTQNQLTIQQTPSTKHKLNNTIDTT